MTDIWNRPAFSPIALFPVRLETRFDGGDLLVRIFPDVVHLDAHDPRLTDAEAEWGERYWRNLHAAASAPADQRDGLRDAAWNELAEALSPERAAWAARLLRPKTVDGTPVFPPVARRTAGAMPEARFRLLPTRWHAVARLGDQEARRTGADIRRDLRLRPRLAPPPPPPGEDGTVPPVPPHDPAESWLTDFDDAVAVGMALRLPLSPQMRETGRIDELIVYGVDEALGPEEGERRVGALLESHAYSRGVGFVAPGTPTNNTSAAPSGFSRRDPAYAASLRVEEDEGVPGSGSGAARAARALGLGLAVRPANRAVAGEALGYEAHVPVRAYARWQARGRPYGSPLTDWLPAEAETLYGQPTGLAAAPHAADTGEAGAEAMNTVLWPATWGYFLWQMMAPAAGEEARRFDSAHLVAEEAARLAALRARVESNAPYEAERQVYTQLAAQWGWREIPDPRGYGIDTEVIRRLAYQRYIDRGRVPGKAVEDWLWAESWLIARVRENTAAVIAAANLPSTSAEQDRAVAESRVRGGRTQLRAFLLAERRGFGSGHALEDWLAAEAAEDFTDDAIRAMREHFIRYVRAGGPFPALRIGDQPYGILPVASLDRWRSSTAGDPHPHLVRILRALRDRVWLESARSDRTPRVGLGDQFADRQTLMLQILGVAPLAERVYARSALGAEYVANLWRFARPELQLGEGWRARVEATSRRLLDESGIAWDPRVTGLVLAEDPSVPLTAPLVAAPGRTPGYFADFTPQAVAARGILGRTGLAAIEPAGTTDSPVPLLHRLLRHGLLVEHAVASFRVQQRRGVLADWEHREAEMVDVFPWTDGGGEAGTGTFLRQLAQTVPGVGITVEQYLVQAAPEVDEDVRALREWYDRAAHLATLPAAELERLAAETLDLAGHRLDAWITSLATRRLDQMRESAPRGVHVGGYGWVEDLRRRDAAQPESDGFVQAPSLAQAATAAVLRAGYRAHRDLPRNPLAVDLTSHRVQRAAAVLDGVRQGQTLSTLLGYRFERALHDRSLSRFIAPFRARFRVLATRLEAYQDPAPSVLTTGIVDGLALRELWRGRLPDEDATPARIQEVFDEEGATAGERGAIHDALAELDDTVDAVADALLTEAVHHAVQGNPMRAGASLDALARGESPPPQLESQRTPRTGVALTHRLVLLANPAAPRPAGWPLAGQGTDVPAGPATRHLRAAAEPVLDAWLARLLPPAAKVRFGARAGTAAVTYVGLDAADLTPLDYLHLAAEDDGSAEGVPQELAAWLRRAARVRMGVAAGTPIALAWELGEDAEDGWISVPDFLVLVRAARDLLASSRPLRDADLDEPGAVDAAEPADDLKARADAAAAALSAAAGVPVDGAPLALADRLRWAVRLGIPGAVAALEAGTEAVAEAVLGEAARRYAAFAALTLPAPRAQTPAAALRTHDLARIRAALGEEFTVLPVVRAPRPERLAESLGASTALQGGDARASLGWLSQAARVRAGAGRAHGFLLAAEAAGAGEPALAVAQLPYRAGERWLALPLAGTNPAGSRLSLVVHRADGAPASGAVAGLVADEWTELLPSAEETTGLAYHVDTPGAQAPHAILLAVPPGDEPAWSPSALEQTVRETLDLARVRAVDFDSLKDVGQVLPAIYLASNPKNATVATDLSRN